jgi:hypothetical protein
MAEPSDLTREMLTVITLHLKTTSALGEAVTKTIVPLAELAAARGNQATMAAIQELLTAVQEYTKAMQASIESLLKLTAKSGIEIDI